MPESALPSQDKKQVARNFIIDRYTADGKIPNLKQASADLDIPYRTLFKMRQRLAKEGILPQPGARGIHTVRAQELRLSKKQKQHDEIVQRVLEGKGEVLTAEQRMVLVSELVKISTPDQAQKLVETLSRLESASGGVENYAPPAPQTIRQAVIRLSRLMKAYGEQVAIAAYCTAFRPEVFHVENVPVQEVRGPQQGSEGDARVQVGPAAQRLEERPQGEVAQASDSDRPVGATQEEPGRVLAQ